MADLLRVKSLLRSVLISAKDGVPLKTLLEEYKEMVGEALPFEDLGYTTLESFLRSVSDVARRKWEKGEIYYHVVPDETTAHIHDLVSKQKRKKKRTKRQEKKTTRQPETENTRRSLNPLGYSFPSSREKGEIYYHVVPDETTAHIRDLVSKQKRKRKRTKRKGKKTTRQPETENTRRSLNRLGYAFPSPRYCNTNFSDDFLHERYEESPCTQNPTSVACTYSMYQGNKNFPLLWNQIREAPPSSFDQRYGSYHNSLAGRYEAYRDPRYEASPYSLNRRYEASHDSLDQIYKTALSSLDQRYETFHDSLDQIYETAPVDQRYEASHESLDQIYEAAPSSLDQRYEASDDSVDQIYETAPYSLDQRYEASHDSLDQTYKASHDSLYQIYETAPYSLERRYEASHDSLDQRHKASHNSLYQIYKTAPSSLDQRYEGSHDSLDQIYETAPSSLDQRYEASDDSLDQICNTALSSLYRRYEASQYFLDQRYENFPFSFKQRNDASRISLDKIFEDMWIPPRSRKRRFSADSDKYGLLELTGNTNCTCNKRRRQDNPSKIYGYHSTDDFLESSFRRSLLNTEQYTKTIGDDDKGTEYRVCRRFLRSTGCKKGNSCKRLHIPAGWLSISDRKKFNLPSKQCKKYLGSGCSKGVRCRLLHISNHKLSRLARSRLNLPPVENCKFFASGGCRYGEKCEYLHAVEEQNPAVLDRESLVDVKCTVSINIKSDSDDDVIKSEPQERIF